jgi:hypothetical protein
MMRRTDPSTFSIFGAFSLGTFAWGGSGGLTVGGLSGLSGFGGLSFGGLGF